MKKKQETKRQKKKDQDQLESYKNDLQRVQAEFENYVKRVEKDKEEIKKFAPHNILIRLLNIQDDFERALKSIENTKNIKDIQTGIAMIYNQIQEVIKESNVTPINALGEKFDPYKHEVIQKVTSKKEAGKIVEEIQKGYMLHDKVLRHSKVKVAEIIKSEDKKNE